LHKLTIAFFKIIVTPHDKIRPGTVVIVSYRTLLCLFIDCSKVRELQRDWLQAVRYCTAQIGRKKGRGVKPIINRGQLERASSPAVSWAEKIGGNKLQIFDRQLHIFNIGHYRCSKLVILLLNFCKMVI